MRIATVAKYNVAYYKKFFRFIMLHRRGIPLRGNDVARVQLYLNKRPSSSLVHRRDFRPFYNNPEHISKVYSTSFTAKYNCNKLVYYETLGRIEHAVAREKQLKNWNRS